jgi:MFS family permease
MLDRLADGVRRKRAELLAILFMDLVYFFTYFQRVAIPGTIFDQLQSDFSMSPASVVLLGGIALYIYGGMQVFAGFAIDRFGAYRVFVIGGVLVSAASVLFPLSNGLAMLFGTRALVGLGASLIYLSVVKEIDNRFDDRNFSVLLSGSIFVGYAGGLYGTAPFEYMVGIFGWRHALLIVGGGCTLALIGSLFFICKGQLEDDLVRDPLPVSLKRVLTNRFSYPILIVGPVVFATYFVVQSTIGKKLLTDCFALRPETASAYTFTMMLTSMTMAVAAGFLSRRLGNRRKPIMVVSTVVSALAGLMVIAALTLHAGPGWILGAYVLFGGSSCASVISCCSMKEVNQPNAAATSVGTLNGAAYCLVAVLATCAGLVLGAYKDHAVVTPTAIHYPMEAYRAYFAGTLVLAICAFVASLMVQETYGCNINDGTGDLASG